VALDDPYNNPQGLLGSTTLLTTPENPTLIPEQNHQAKIWHRFYIQSIAQNFQIQLTMNNLQLSNSPANYNDSISNNDLTLHAMTLYLSPTARMIQ
jgi:hypothetical protein